MERKIPPKQVPPDLFSKYTMNGKIPVGNYYFDDSYPPEKPLVYEKETVDLFIERIKRKVEFNYGSTDRFLHMALEKFKIAGKDVAIMGSTRPLYESVCLFYGGKPITIEYNKIITSDCRLRVMTVDEYNKNPRRFEVALSISSFEHDGLGRYGDALNPDGDLEAMKRMKSIIEPKGLLFLAVPVGKDAIEWNAHRIYGEIRLPQLLRGWKVLDYFYAKPVSALIAEQPLFDYVQPIFVLENSESENFESNCIFRTMPTEIAFYKMISVVSKIKNNIIRQKLARDVKYLQYTSEHTLSNVDRINDSSPGGAPVCINSQKEDSITVQGWALDESSKSGAKSVFINIDGKIDIPALYGLYRSDVAEHYKNDGYLYSGFRAYFKTSLINSGVHTLILKIVDSQGKKYYLSDREITLHVE